MREYIDIKLEFNTNFDERIEHRFTFKYNKQLGSWFYDFPYTKHDKTIINVLSDIFEEVYLPFDMHKKENFIKITNLFVDVAENWLRPVMFNKWEIAVDYYWFCDCCKTSKRETTYRRGHVETE